MCPALRALCTSRLQPPMSCLFCCLPPLAAVATVERTSEGGDASSHQSGGPETALVSDYSRGKRLKKLLRLLNSRAAMEIIVTFRSHMWVAADSAAGRRHQTDRGDATMQANCVVAFSLAHLSSNRALRAAARPSPLAHVQVCAHAGDSGTAHRLLCGGDRFHRRPDVLHHRGQCSG